MVRPKMERQHICVECSSPFPTNKSSQLYCPGGVCKSLAASSRAKAKRQSATIAKKLDRFPGTAFGSWVIREVIRAGTVEILRNNDLEGLYELYLYCHRTYSYDHIKKESYYQICHIHPVKGGETIGLLHPDNLFVGRKHHNNSQQNKKYGENEHFIEKSKLDKKWTVKKNSKKKTTFNKIKKYLGTELVEFVTQHNLEQSNRTKLANRIHKSGITAHTLPELESMDIQVLEALNRDVPKQSGQKEHLQKHHDYKRERKRSLLVYLEQLQRKQAINPSAAYLIPYVNVVIGYFAGAYSQGFSEYFQLRSTWGSNPFEIPFDKDESTFRDWFDKTLYETLAGKELDQEKFKGTFNSYLQFAVSYEQTIELLKLTADSPFGSELLSSFITTNPHTDLVRESAADTGSNPCAISLPAILENIKNVNLRGDEICNNIQVSKQDSKIIFMKPGSKVSSTVKAQNSEPILMQYMKAS